MKSENYIKCYEVLRKELGSLCEWNCKIWDMEKAKGKHKIKKAIIEKEKASLALVKEHFRGMCDMANLTGEFVYPNGHSSIDGEFGWFFK
jgi:hypothetical protein